MPSFASFFGFISLLFLPFFLFCQSDYIDQSFGLDGTTELILSDSINATMRNISFDRFGRIYFSYDIPLENNLRENGIRRLTKSGRLMDWGREKQFDFFSNNWFSYYCENGKIITTNITPDTLTEGFSTLYTFYDLEWNLEKQFDDLSPYESIIDYFYYNRRFLIDEQNRFVKLNMEGLKRYTAQGDLDYDFGDNGFSSFLFDQDTIPSLNFYFLYNFLFESSDNSLLAIFYTAEERDSSEVNFQKLIKYDESGVVDRSFGVDGLIEFEDYNIIWEVQGFRDGYLVEGYKILSDSCLNFEADAIVLDKNGEPLVGYGDNGRLRNKADDCYESNYWWFQVGPSDEVICINVMYDFNESTQQHDGENYRFLKFDQNGHIDTSFAEAGYLPLDVLDDGRIAEVVMDDDDNIFILHFPNSDTVAPLPYYLTKFDGDMLWDKRSINNPHSNFTITPNPTSDQVGLSYSGDQMDDVKVLLFDLQGRLVSTDYIASLSDKDRISLSHNTLAAGTYFVKVRNANGASVFNEKVIVLK